MGILGFTYNAAKAAFKGKGKVSPTITSVKSGKNLTTKRNIQDKVVKAVDEGVKKSDVPQSFKELQKTKQYASETKRKKSKELKDYSYRLDKLTEKKATGGRVGKMGGGMMGRRMGYSQGKLAVTPREKQLAAQYGDKKRITRGDVITAAKKKSGKRMQASVGGGADSGRIGQLRSDLRIAKNLTEMKAALKKADKDRNKFDMKDLMRDRMKQPFKTIKNTPGPQFKKDRKRKIGSNVYRRKP